MTKSGQKALKIQENYRNLHVESLQRLLLVLVTGGYYWRLSRL